MSIRGILFGMVEQTGKLLIGAGLILAFLGVLFVLSSKLPFPGPGRLPGDFSFKVGNMHIYFPLATGILLSILFSALSFLIHYLRGGR